MSKAEPSQTPLVELARSVPKDIRLEWEIQWSEDGAPTGHSMAPVGLYLHELAERLESLTAERDAYEAIINDDGSLTTHQEKLEVLADMNHALKTLGNVEALIAERDALKAENAVMESALRINHIRIHIWKTGFHWWIVPKADWDLAKTLPVIMRETEPLEQQ